MNNAGSNAMSERLGVRTQRSGVGHAPRQACARTTMAPRPRDVAASSTRRHHHKRRGGVPTGSRDRTGRDIVEARANRPMQRPTELGSAFSGTQACPTAHINASVGSATPLGFGTTVLGTPVPYHAFRSACSTVPDRLLDGALSMDATATARRHAAAGDPVAAMEVIDEALALWRGRPFEEFADESWAVGEVTRTIEMQVELREIRAELLLELGRPGDVIADMDALMREHPYREGPRTLQMQALYHAGRQAEALRVFQGFRRLLVDEVGLEPSVDLVELDRRIATSPQTARVESDRCRRPPRLYANQPPAAQPVDAIAQPPNRNAAHRRGPPDLSCSDSPRRRVRRLLRAQRILRDARRTQERRSRRVGPQRGRRSPAMDHFRGTDRRQLPAPPHHTNHLDRTLNTTPEPPE